MDKKKKKALLFLIIAAIAISAFFFMNHQRADVESYTMRELGQETVTIIDEFLDNTLPVEAARAYIAHMLDAIDYHVENRRDPLSIREGEIRLAMSRLHLDLTFPNATQITASRNRLAGLVRMPER